MKKIVSVLMSLIMVFTVIPIIGLTASAKTDGYYTYTVSNGKSTITDCSTSISGDISIPSTLGGCSVTSIGWHAFYGCTSLTSVTIPNSVKSIGDGAFLYCTSLISINVDENNENYCDINGILFNKDKTELIQYTIGKTDTSYTIPDSVTSIGAWAFYNCTSLTSVTIPNSVTSIGDNAFIGCESLTSVTIGNSVTSIGDNAFSGCESLTSVTIGNSVTSIGSFAFYNCESLTSINVDENNENYCDINGILFNKDKTELIQYPIGKTDTSYTIPDSVTSIYAYAFIGCESLTSVTIGNSVTSIGDNAFSGCESLTSVTIGNSVTSIGDNAFRYCTSLTSVTIGNSVTSIGSYAFSNCTSLTSVTIPDSVTRIGASAFRWCSSLTSVTIGNSVTSIDYYAFSGCESLTSVTIPDSVTSIGEKAFLNCTSLTSVTIGNSVTSIGVDAFYGCESLTSITIPDSVTSIGYDAFHGCNIEELIIADGSKTVTSKIVVSKSRLKKVIIPNSITSIDDDAFYGCYADFYCDCTNSYVLNYLKDNKYNRIITHDYSILKYDTMWHWYKCSNCSSTTPNQSHSGGTATCTSQAVCSICNQSYGSTPSGHNYTEKIIVSPTCEDEGKSSYTCSRCNDTYEKETPALGHDYTEEIIIPPTCEDEGKSSYTCSRCNDTYEKETPALGHDFVVTNTVKPTVLSNGYDILECQRYGCRFEDYFYYDNQLPIEYNKAYYENGTDQYKVNLDKSGFLTFEFIGESEKWNINIYDEDYRKVDTLKPVYKEFFKKSYLQAGVGSAVPNENQITALFSGTYYVVIERVEDDTNANYSGDYQFSVQYHSSNETLTETKYDFYYDAPTSREIKLNKKYSGFLGSKYAAYNYSGDEITVSDTRDAYKIEFPKGSGWSQLSVTLSSKSFPPLSSNCTISIYNADFDLCEDFTPLTVSADEEKNEITYLYEGIYYIAVSSYTPVEYTFSTVYKPTGTFVCTTHKGKLVETKNPTCTNNGYYSYICSICKTKYKEVIPAKGHNLVIDKACEATCLTTGLTEGKHCSVCGKVLTAQKKISAQGHKIITLKTKKATYFSTGYKNRKICKVCKKVVNKGKTLKKLKLKVPTFTVKCIGKGKVKISWKKVKDATGIYIVYDTQKACNFPVGGTEIKGNKTSKVLKNLASCDHYFKAEAFIYKNGKYVSSERTKAIKVKVK